MSHPLPTYTDPTRILDQRVKLAFAPCCRTSAHRCYYSLVTGQADRADTPLICQTPWLWLPCAPRYIVRQGARTYFFHLAFWNVADSPEQQTWLKLLRVLQTTFHGWVQRKHTGHGGAPVQWVPCLDTPLAPTYAFHDQVGAGAAAFRGGAGTGAGPVHWKFHTRLPPSVGCYDAAGMAMDVSDVMTKGQATYVRLIVHLANVWVNEDTGTAGLGVHVLQFQQSGVAPPRTYAFRDASVTQRTCGCQTESTGAVVNAREAATRHHTAAATDPHAPTARPSADAARTLHPVYGTFFRMRAKGVPKPAVQHKMRMNGLDPAVLDLPPDAPLPGGDGSDETSGGGGPVDLLALSLQDGQQLRKTEVNADRKTRKPASGAGHGFSLGEIVNGLKSLRRTLGFGAASGGRSSAAGSSADADAETDKAATDPHAVAHTPASALGDRGAPESSFLQLLASRVS